MRIQTLFIVLALIFSPLSFAKALKDKAQVDKIAARFVSQLQKGEISAAYNSVAPFKGVSDEQFAKRSEKGIQDMTQLQTQAGKPLSIPVLSRNSVGEHFYKIVHLIKYREAAIVCEMNFYQPDNGWYLVDISFHTDINALFDTLADS